MSDRKPLEEFVLSPIQRKALKKEKKIQDIWEMLRGDDGDDGNDGVSIAKAEVNEEGCLILTLTDGKTIDVGVVRGKDGEPAEAVKAPEIDIDEIVARVRALIPEIEEIDTEKITASVLAAITLPVPKTAAELVKEIVDAKLTFPASVIKDLEKILKEAERRLSDGYTSQVQTLRLTGGNTSLRVKLSGVPVGQVETINLIGGTVTSVGDGREINYTPPGASSFSVLAATGTVDDSNTAFTFLSAPALVCINGAFYRSGNGVTIVGTSVTTDSPVGTGGDIYGIS